MKRIAIIGTGYVGLTAGVAFAKKSNRVICIDKNEAIIQKLQNGIVTIHEPGLERIFEVATRRGLLSFSSDLGSSINASDIIFIAVGTPSGEDGSADLSYVRSVAEEIGEKMDHPLIVVNKSTVPVFTGKVVEKIIAEKLRERGLEIDFWVLSNPEFMAEGRAVKDMLSPSRVVVGAENKEVINTMRLLYASFMIQFTRFFSMGREEAELTKYASNAILALRLSFINVIAILCDLIGANVDDVRIGMVNDPRIGSQFLYPSLGYGGSCFPKDVRALIYFAKMICAPSPCIKLLEAIEDVNNYQKTIIPRKVLSRFGQDLTGLKFALWGLSFKANTNDMRESAAIDIVKHLVAHGAEVYAYDPLAVEEAQSFYLKDIEHVFYEKTDMYRVIPGCDALIIATETDEYHDPDFDFIKESLTYPVIFDGRNLSDIKTIKELGFEYYGIGKNTQPCSFVEIEL